MKAIFAGVVALGLVTLAPNARAQSVDWQGFWVGAGVGGAAATWRATSQTRGSVLGTVEVGYNWTHGPFMIGPTARVGLHSDPWLGFQFRGGFRAGVLVAPNLLLHAGGGAVNMGQIASLFVGVPPISTFTEHPGSAGRGWGAYAAAGVEYRINQSWSFGVDYSFNTVRGSGLLNPATIFVAIPTTVRATTSTHEVTTSLRYRF